MVASAPMNTSATRLLAVAATLAALLAGCGRACKDEVKGEETSPDGRFVAGVLERNCGATTQYADFVAIRKSDERWDSGAADRAVLMLAWQSPIAAFWRKDGTLVVRIKKDVADRVVKRRDSYEGISIKHVVEAEAPPNP
jgi:hypothetical protein